MMGRLVMNDVKAYYLSQDVEDYTFYGFTLPFEGYACNVNLALVLRIRSVLRQSLMPYSDMIEDELYGVRLT